MSTSSALTVILISIVLLTGCTSSKEENKGETTNNIKKSESMLNADRIMSDGSYQIRFSDLVSLSDLQEYNNKTVTAIGYLSPITSYDGSFGYLMNLPYQTCPYCMPSDTKITNTISIFSKSGKKIEFTEAAIMVRGTLKLEEYTDAYGYSYNYRIVDATIEEADTSELGEKIVLYNKLAEKEIMTNLMETLYAVDNNVYYDEYISQGATYDRAIVDLTNLEKVINDLVYFDNLKIVQNKNYFNFSLDSVLLPDFVQITPNTKKIIDFCKYFSLLILSFSKRHSYSTLRFSLLPLCFSV